MSEIKLAPSMDADYITKMLTPAVNNLLEMSLEGAVDIEEEVDLWELVILVYPRYMPGAPFSQMDIPVYMIKCAGKEGIPDSIYYKIGEERAMAAVKREMPDPDWAYVQVTQVVDD